MDEKTNCRKIFRKLWAFLWKFNKQFYFLIIFGKFVTNNRAFGNNIHFLKQFFDMGENFPFSVSSSMGGTLQNLEIFVKNDTKSQWKPAIFRKFSYITRYFLIFWSQFKLGFGNLAGFLIILRKSKRNLETYSPNFARLG